jgi:hypothetical protein
MGNYFAAVAYLRSRHLADVVGTLLTMLSELSKFAISPENAAFIRTFSAAQQPFPYATQGNE